ncbi:MAG: hypothetical protein WBK46_09285 [Ruminococcus flavefaciens]|nr:MAG: hypothetical protein BWZ04_00507 [Firmicutes bacterium ADurb.BinA205]HOC33851.1 hypothetical protein [Ruminococcus flavefaciens]HQM01195.1 hypothetical protein [Ruminococcus flavefaciens]
MNLQVVKLLFKLFSGFDCEASTEYDPVIEISVAEVERMVISEDHLRDARLCYLSAALANYRYRQLLCAQDRSEITFAGKMSKDEHDISLNYAEKMFRDYLHLCSDIIKTTDFVFAAFANGEEV